MAGNPITGTGLQDAVNQLLFATNLFHKLLYINWFALTSFCNQALLSTPVMLGHPLSKDWILPSDIHDEKSLANLDRKNVSCANKSLFTELHSFNLRIGPVLFRLTTGNTLVMECKYFKLEKQNFL